MQFRVLGSFEVDNSTGPLPLGGPKERRLLAVLVARRGQVVAVDELVEGIWGLAAPSSAAKTVQGYVLHLRRALAGAGAENAIHTRAPGYLLDVPPDVIDAEQFQRLVERGRAAISAGEFAVGKVLLDEAVGLWRGRPYLEFAGAAFADAEANRLEALWILAIETRTDARLGLGEAAELVAGLEQLVAENPFYERFWAQLVLALYRSGRQADALAACRRARQTLIEELGVDPGPELRELEQAVLAHDPRLEPAGSHEVLTDADGPDMPLEGRDRELTWMRAAWRKAVDGHGRVVVVHGARGIGRTRLLAELAREARASGASVVVEAGGRAPQMATLVGRLQAPVLVLLDGPVTGLSPETVDGMAALVVVAIDPDRAASHVREALSGCDCLVLRPLDPVAAQRVVERLAAAAGLEVDADSILLAGQGNPATLRELTVQALDSAAVAHRDRASGASAAARVGLRGARAELADAWLALQRVRALGPGAPDAAQGRRDSPWMGLGPYGAGDSWLFRGRDALVADLVARLAEAPLLAVVGGSGTGKSSVVLAGLLPALSDGALPGSRHWAQHVCSPTDPFPALGAKTAVVVVDQFEETWTALGAERTAYLDCLLDVLARGHRVVLTMRADYLERCGEHPRLASRLSDGTVLVGALDDAEVRAVVTEPARAFGVGVEPELLDQILADVRAQPAALPLLSTALVAAWGRRRGAVLRAEDYRASGGVAEAVARVAEQAYAALTEDGRAAARRVLLRLAQPGEGGVVVRRRVARAELGADPLLGAALDVLIAHRLVTADEGSVEIAHEALFTHWPRLAGWLVEDEQGRQLRAYLAPAAVEWDLAGRPTSDLLRGVRLAAVSGWATEHPADLTVAERDLVAASTAETGRELATERARADREARQRRRLRRSLLAAAGLLVVTLIAASVAYVQRQSARHATSVATAQRASAQAAQVHAVARQLSADALVDPVLDRSLLLAAAADRLDDSAQARSTLFAALLRNPAAIRVLHGDAGPLYTVAVSGDGHEVVAAGQSGDVLTWAMPSGQVLRRPPPYIGWGVIAVSARPGTATEMVVSGVQSDTGQPVLLLWDAGQRSPMGALPGVTASVTSLAWSPDGRWLAGAPINGDVLVWDLRNPDAAPRHIPGARSPNRAVVYAGAGRFAVLQQSGAVTVWRPGAPTPDRRFNVGAGVTAVSATRTGTMLAIGHTDGRTALWSLASGAKVGALSGGSLPVESLAFDPDGQQIAIAAPDGGVAVTQVSGGAVLQRLAGQPGGVTALTFSPDGAILLTASIDGTVIAWDAAGDHQPDLFFTGSRGPGATAIAVSSRGQLAQAHDDGDLQRWDAATGRTLGPPQHLTSTPIRSMAYSSDGATLALSTVGGSVQLWDATASHRLGMLSHLGALAPAISFSPDGRRLAVGMDSGVIRLFDANRLTSAGPEMYANHDAIGEIAWSPDSRRIAVSYAQPPAISVFDTDTGQIVWGHDAGSLAAWSPDGRTLAVAQGVRVQLLDAASGASLAAAITEHSQPIDTVAFSPDGRRVASSSNDGTTVLLDVATRQIAGEPPSTLSTDGSIASFSRFDTSGHLFIGSTDGALWSWDLTSADWRRLACTIAGRDLTRDEWVALDTGLPAIRACPS